MGWKVVISNLQSKDIAEELADHLRAGTGAERAGIKVDVEQDWSERLEPTPDEHLEGVYEERSEGEDG